jgi:hypothetical protein
MDNNSAAWSYFKVAFLMFAALFIVWVPSTINRLQQFIHKDNPVFGLNLASAMVLPLQGFWNAMVYMSTTWPECKRAVQEIMDCIAATNHNCALPATHSRRDSEHTLTAAEVDEFGPVDVALRDVHEDSPSYAQSRTHMQSNESISKPTEHRSNAS